MNINPNALRRAYLIGDARRICRDFSLQEENWEKMPTNQIAAFVENNSWRFKTNDDNHDEKHTYER